MLVTFKSPSHGDITMFGDVARQLLKMMGQTGNVPGAVMAEDVPAALASLNAALARNPQSVHTGQDDEDEAPVALETRAAPLRDMLASAAEAEEHVSWDS